MERSQISVVFNQEAARSYETFYTTEYGSKVDRVEKSLVHDLIRASYPNGVPSGTTLLEIGCGTGVWTSFFQSLGFTVTAIDPSEAMLELAREKKIPNTLFLQGEAENLPFPDATFDAAATIAVLEFVEDPHRAMEEIFRVLKPGGWFFGGFLNRDSELGKHQAEDPILRHGRLYTLSEIESYLQPFSQIETHGCAYLTNLWNLADGTPEEPHWKPAFYGVRAQKQGEQIRTRDTSSFSISVEISYYPLTNEYGKVIGRFIERMKNSPGVHVEIGSMSTLLSGEYNAVFDLLQREIRSFMEQYPSIFTLKIANACPR